MRYRLVMVGKHARGHVQEGVREYVGRIVRMAPLDEVVVPEAGQGGPGHQRRAEGQRLLAALRPEERVIALDERGELMTSREFAGHLVRLQDTGVRQVAFVVGGAYGLDEPVRARADMLLSLSPMTFPHQLVRLLFVEQLYRALMIMRGSGYHH
ncbi:MAG: 23S rRNA (pseudouridine(1915)-N(3))-methyltransferase RlmH [Flavobacteriales bacterium]|nr:23S rRNA (pseudouridine(1915)-N(3))-methyltransferase RlmH [Flavobacteriales bacterium]